MNTYSKLKRTSLYIVALALSAIACDGFLDLKPDRQMMVPSTLDDCQALLDNLGTMNQGYPNVGEAASDDYFIRTPAWMGLSATEDRENYIWEPNMLPAYTHWIGPYKVIYTANQVLKIIEKIEGLSDEQVRRKASIRGAALFYRGYAYHQLVSVFANPYDASTATSDAGVPLRLTPDVENTVGRGTVQQVYDQIINDLASSVPLLTRVATHKSRPSKTAAFAALARAYLDMMIVGKAHAYADSALTIQPDLMDFNELNENASLPIQRFNNEVIFHTIATYIPSMGQGIARIDSNLMLQYAPNDRRKSMFFRKNSEFGTETYSFKGSYDGTTTGFFNGLTTSEMYLIKAETLVRLNRLDDAVNSLNTLLLSRTETDLYSSIETMPQQDLLNKVLLERRKELIFRGRRWSDLRRLNKDGQTAITISREINDKTYTLPPNDPRYTLLLPLRVINTTNFQQNKR